MGDDEPGLSFAAAAPAEPYRVLARKHRPQNFDALVGQEAMVRVLRNAFDTGRIAHAFLLTGVRGIGKTTTARIVAKGLNCVGPDGTGGPTVAPCGVCDPCRRIAEGRFIDVLEIDAASNNGVEFVRDLNEMARTAPASRYRVFILDEVHMLSTAAFNALLKTLEEPPGHTKFILATTEIRRVPVTVLSRCQRFDLRRIEPEAMLAFLRRVADAEGAAVDDEALGLVARASEGSARDALSLLDQAIAHGAGAPVDAAAARSVLGLADRGRSLDLFERIMAGDAAGALAELGAQYAEGADPAAALRDLAEIAHWLSMARVTPEAADDPTAPAAERARIRDMAGRLSMRALTRAWQMLLKALEEVARAPNAMMAAEMAVIRLTHVADLPSPEELVRRLTAQAPEGAPAPAPRGGPAGPAPGAVAAPRPGGARDGGPAAGAPPAASAQAAGAPAARAAPVPAPRGPALATSAPAPLAAAAPEPEGAAAAALAVFPDFDAVLALIRARRDAKLMVDAETFLRLVRYAPGRIEFEPAPGAPADLAGELTRKLSQWTGARWVVTVASSGGGPTAAEARAAAFSDLRARAASDPLVLAAFALFPGAQIKAVRPRAAAAAAEPAAEATDDAEAWAPVDDGWEPVDPFDEE
jgi:DNA polymerase-3 subunit gamma/tau